MIKYSTDRHIARITLARPEAANALSGEMLRQFADALRAVRDSAARALCISGEGRHFCAGADVGWMRDSAQQSAEENREEAAVLADLLLQLHTLPQPSVAVVQGACVGGGVGLAAAADICLAADDAKFRFSEVRLGLIPATISPYVVAAIGARAARRYFLDGANFDGARARQLGLVHEVCAEKDLPALAEQMLADLCQGGAQAQRQIKTLLANLRQRNIDGALAQETAEHLATCRAGEEAREGIAAFLEKRAPRWREGE